MGMPPASVAEVTDGSLRSPHLPTGNAAQSLWLLVVTEARRLIRQRSGCNENGDAYLCRAVGGPSGWYLPRGALAHFRDRTFG